MTERFIIDILDENNWLIQDTKTGENANPIDGTTNVLKGLISTLNKFNDENEQLNHNNKMLSMKMSEVYTKYCLLKEFSGDTNPNDAVKKVLSELMQITKKYR